MRVTGGDRRLFAAPVIRAGLGDFRPLFALLKRLVLQSSVLWTDDTTVRLLDPQAEGGSRTARFWTCIVDAEHPDTVYDFTPSRSRDGPAAFLSKYRG